ncbi:MAG: hypothetical protein HQL63_02535 [Magnetococcales bacterium]|nr:hypothetical protein [Magnetococcales bacterium]MBF0323221.1 hypothetical protein [Magnetococcales bacterium]
MATFLEICQKVRREAGVSGNGPPAVTGQSGVYEKIIQWVNDAWVEIQNAHTSWHWMWQEFSFDTVAGVGSYTLTSLNMGEMSRLRLDSLSLYLKATGPVGEGSLPYVNHRVWRRQFGSGLSVVGKPALLSLTPDRLIKINPIPDDIYTVRGVYYRRAQRMATNDDVPGLPVEFHDAIVQLALLLYAANEEAPEMYAAADMRLRIIMRNLERHQLDTPELEGGSIA